MKVALRNLWKNRLFALINMMGLGIALACCIVAYLNWEYNAKFDTYHQNTEAVYRINFTRDIDGRSSKNGSCPLPLAKVASTNIKEIDLAVRYMPTMGNFKINNQIFRTSLTAVDPEFMEIFTFPLVQGSESSLKDSRTIWINEILRNKYWPEKDDIIGETLTYIDGSTMVDFQVGGVFVKPPNNTSFWAEAYINYESLFNIENRDLNDWSGFNSTFVRLKNRADVVRVETQLQDFVAPQNKVKNDYKVARYYLDPFDGMAVRAEKDDIYNHWFIESLPTAAANAPGVMAFLLLLLACFNYTNTSIATVNRRIKEIGIRKVMGSNRRQIMLQFFGENLLLTFMSLLLGILLAAFLVPAYSAMWIFLDIKFNLFENLQLILFLGSLLILAAILSGLYPTMYVSHFQPTAIFRGTVKFSGTNWFMRILLILQFSLSLIAIICGFVFSQNAKFQESYDLGFNVESVLCAYVKDENGYRTFRNQLEDIPEIIKIAGAKHNFTSSWYTDPINAEDRELDVNIFGIGSGYLRAMSATILKGRDFLENSEHDARNSVIINEDLAKKLGWQDPIDKKLTLRDTVKLSVIGLVKDIYFDGDLFDPLEPMLLRLVQPDDFRFLVVKTNSENARKVKELMDAKWKNVFPNEISTVVHLREDKVESVEVNANIRKLFVFLALVAVVLSAIGLFSMVSLNINKRLKEIGIRKVLGASTANIAMGISREFLVVLVIASILGAIGGLYLAEMLMASIWAYYVPIKFRVLMMGVAVLMAVSILTIGSKVLKASSAIPSQILRD